MAGRISLVEEYENKDMIVQVKKCLDQTEAAVEASETARDVSIASAAEAHEASTNANSASAQAQTAAQTVATYGARLQAAEDGVAGNRSSIQTIDGEITDIYNDLTNVVRKVGDPGQIVYNGLELRGTNRTSDTVVGQLDDMIVNAKRLINEIDAKMNAYEQMVRTSGNQVIDGIKTFNKELTRSMTGGGRIALQMNECGTNNYVTYARDAENHLRVSENNQCVLSGDRMTRLIFTLNSPDYSATEQTGASAELVFELLPNGRTVLRISRTKGDGSTVRKTIESILESE